MTKAHNVITKNLTIINMTTNNIKIKVNSKFNKSSNNIGT